MVAQTDVAALRSRLRGELIQPRDSGYEEARKLWNGMIDKRPALITRCRGVADVTAAVDFTRENDLLLDVRGGGHNVAGMGVADGGLVVDLPTNLFRANQNIPPTMRR